MNNEFYKLLKNDLDNTVNKVFKEDLRNALNEIDNLYKIYNDLVLEDDLKIIIANYGVIKIKELSYMKSMDHDKEEIKELENVIELYYKYFDGKDELEEYSDKENYSFGNIIDVQNEVKRVLNKNTYSILFNVMGTVLIIIGLIISIVTSVLNQNFISFLLTFGAYILFSLIFYGMAGLFNILHEIRKKLYIK